MATDSRFGELEAGTQTFFESVNYRPFLKMKRERRLRWDSP
jgi:hypothetical protein